MLYLDSKVAKNLWVALVILMTNSKKWHLPDSIFLIRNKQPPPFFFKCKTKTKK